MKRDTNVGEVSLGVAVLGFSNHHRTSAERQVTPGAAGTVIIDRNGGSDVRKTAGAAAAVARSERIPSDPVGLWGLAERSIGVQCQLTEAGSKCLCEFL